MRSPLRGAETRTRELILERLHPKFSRLNLYFPTYISFRFAIISMTQHIDESITQSEGCKIFSQSRFIRLLHIGIEIRLPLSLDRGALHWAPYSIPGFLAGQMSCGHAIWRGYFCLCFPFRVGCWWLDTGGNGGATLGMSMREIERLLATICAHFLCDSWRFHRRGRKASQRFQHRNHAPHRVGPAPAAPAWPIQ